MKQSETGKKAVKDIYTKAVMMGMAVLLLAAAIIFFTTAWYTKMVSMAGVSLQAAKWDFTANHTVDAVSVNVFDYASLNDDRAAPGAAGWIPIKLAAYQSDTDIQYTLMVDRSTMSEEFRKRIFFYYLENEGEQDEKKIYFGASPADPTSTQQVQMTGMISKGADTNVKVYWEWIYEAPSDATDADKLRWDEFDTAVGANPTLYSADMNATVTVAGVEVNPETTRK